MVVDWEDLVEPEVVVMVDSAAVVDSQEVVVKAEADSGETHQADRGGGIMVPTGSYCQVTCVSPALMAHCFEPRPSS